MKWLCCTGIAHASQKLAQPTAAVSSAMADSNGDKSAERAGLTKHLPVLAGKVKAVLAKRDNLSEADLSQRFVQFGPVSFSYKDIIAFSEVCASCTFSAEQLSGC